jgi:hypothetical protein
VLCCPGSQGLGFLRLAEDFDVVPTFMSRKEARQAYEAVVRLGGGAGGPQVGGGGGGRRAGVYCHRSGGRGCV